MGNDSTWLWWKDRKEMDPVTWERLCELAQAGELKPLDMVWTQPMADWLPAIEIENLFQRENTSQWDGGALSYYNTKAAMDTRIRYAGFWLRFGAFVIDVVLIRVFIFATSLVFVFGLFPDTPLFQVINVLVDISAAWLYLALFESSTLQATPGKMALGLVVTDLNGYRIGFWRASGRAWGMALSYALMCIGFMMAGWTERSQTLHDKMAGTLVIQKSSAQWLMQVSTPTTFETPVAVETAVAVETPLGSVVTVAETPTSKERIT